ncbi:RHS repeat-associated core domain-containing protein [Streptomyces sp. NPDC053367]|uniref:RHS repeat-associated core domain-containing protein n=1 Tax=Streptomyces sp. NPDC053367 TaxID=3365700 RepID=UPI0037D541C9
MVESIDYNANGQRTAVRYGNGTVTDYSYEDSTLRLLAITTTGPGPDTSATEGPSRVLQDIRYTYDPVGTVTRIENHSFEAAFCYGQPANPLSEYTYDALYRLVRSTGRRAPSTSPPPQDEFMLSCPPRPEARRVLEDYAQVFGYDDSGNLIHVGEEGPVRSTSRLDVAPDSNRLACEPYDANGNPLAWQGLRRLEWGSADTLLHTELPDGRGESSFLYDHGRARVAKLERRAGVDGGQLDTRETVYVGDYRSTRATSGPATTEQQTVSVTDDGTCVCLVGYEPDEDHWSYRYQLHDAQGSVAWEVDALGQPLNYQEYLAYGAGAFITADERAQAEDKEFGYSGKEFDTRSGLSYFGERYYSASRGRWLSPDPLGSPGGLNLYAFVEGNPVSKIDTTGEMGVWLSSVIGAVVTLGTGYAAGSTLGHAMGVGSGFLMGTLAGAVGATAGGVLAGAGVPAIFTTAASTALMSAAGSLVGHFTGQLSMRRAAAAGWSPLAVSAIGG